MSLKRAFRIAHLAVASLILAGIVIQPFLIGLTMFGALHSAGLHDAVGHGLVEGGIVLLLISALLARLPKADMLLTVLLMVDLFLQLLVVSLRDTSPVVAALHPMNALALLLIAITVVRHDRILLRRPETEVGGTVPAP